MGTAKDESSTDRRRAFLCSYAGCLKTFRRRDAWNYHLLQHEGVKFACEHEGCSREFLSNSGLQKHLKKKHRSNECDEEKKTSGAQLPCTKEGCERKFMNKDSLKKHLKVFHAAKDYKCGHCGKEFQMKRRLKIHEVEHTGIAPFKCLHESCDKAFLLPSKLKQHQKIHEGYKCDATGCNDKFEKWTLYQKHRKLAHPKGYECDVCKRSFRSKSNLKAHKVVHEEERELFKCAYEGCPKFYFLEKNLKNHVSSSHEGKRVKCTNAQCGKEFKNRASLVRHLKLHDPKEPIPPPKMDCNKKKRRKRRTDCGLRRKSAAALVTGFEADPNEDRQLIKHSQASARNAPTKLEVAHEMMEVKITPLDEGLKLLLQPKTT